MNLGFAFDLETTGLDVEKDEPVEIAFALIKPEGEYHITSLIVNTAVPVNPEALKVHKIGPELIKHGIVTHVVASFLDSILDRHSIDTIIGYNIFKFDIPMLQHFLRRNGHDIDFCNDYKIEDVALWWCADKIFHCPRPVDLAGLKQIADRRLPFGSRYNLASVCEQNAHRASADLEATIELWRKLRTKEES